MEKTKRPQVPSFGDWNYNTELPVKKTSEAGYGLSYVSSPVKPNYRQNLNKGSKGGVERHYTKRGKAKQKKEVRRAREVAIKPVDEDLYKIPSELLSEKPRKMSSVRSLLTGCLGLSCFA